MNTYLTKKMNTTLLNDLKVAKEMVYDKIGLEMSPPILNTESAEYGACTFCLNGMKIYHRVSKITPTKPGQFVTIWKRNNDGITAPFLQSDDFDFLIITARSGGKFGQFIFPKSVLAEKGIISTNDKEGKCGMRVYPPWDVAGNTQAEKTKSWQTLFFLTITNDRVTELHLMRELFLKI